MDQPLALEVAHDLEELLVLLPLVLELILDGLEVHESIVGRQLLVDTRRLLWLRWRSSTRLRRRRGRRR